MHINFKSIHIENFMSIGTIDFDINNLGYVLVSGINNNPKDSAKSNGSGKSSIFEALIWALTGETLRGTKQITNQFTSDGTCVTLKFSVDNDLYELSRYKDYKNIGTNLKIIINNIDKSGKGIRDSEKLLESYLPELTLNLIGAVIVLGQGLPQRFTNNTPSGRKDVLEQMSKSDFMILDIKDKLSKRKIDLGNQLRTIEDTILATSTEQNILNNQLVKLLEQKESLVDIVSFDSQISGFENIINSLNSTKINLETDINLKQKELDDKLDNYQQLNEQLDINYNNKCLEIKKQLQLENLLIDIQNISSEIKSRNDEIKKLESIKDTCPTCGQKLPDVHKVDTTSLHKQVDDLNIELTRLNQIKQTNELDYNNQCKQLKENLYKDLTVIKESTQSLRISINDLNNEYKNLNEQLAKNQIEIDRLKLIKSNNEKLSQSIITDIENVKTKLNQISEKILYNNVEKDNKKNHLDVISKMITIASRDFRGFLLSEIINYINKKAKEYCLDIFETDLIDFILDGNNININYCGKEYENLSGGEKQKIDVIIQFALRDMLTQFSNFSSNILVCDEIFDNCDAIGCQKIINLISKKLNDVDSIFIITHHESDLAIPYDLQINIVKNELGISEIIK